MLSCCCTFSIGNSMSSWVANVTKSGFPTEAIFIILILQVSHCVANVARNGKRRWKSIIGDAAKSASEILEATRGSLKRSTFLFSRFNSIEKWGTCSIIVTTRILSHFDIPTPLSGWSGGSIDVKIGDLTSVGIRHIQNHLNKRKSMRCIF